MKPHVLPNDLVERRRCAASQRAQAYHIFLRKRHDIIKFIDENKHLAVKFRFKKTTTTTTIEESLTKFLRFPSRRVNVQRETEHFALVTCIRVKVSLRFYFRT